MKKIYLAIPYTGMQESSYKQATAAAAYVSQVFRYNVFSPITHSHPLAEMGLHGTWEDYWKKVDFQYIDWADEAWVVVPDEGAERVRISLGVQDEINYCKAIGKPLSFVKFESREKALAEITHFTQIEGVKFLEEPVAMKFTENDILDKDLLERMVEQEAQDIYSSEAARKGRDFESVKLSVRQGKIAELYLIENYGHKKATKKWHDLINPEGEYVEVKAYNTTTSKAPFIERDLMRIKREGWNKATWYVIFKCVDGRYELLEKIRIR